MGHRRIKRKGSQERLFLTRPPAPIEPVVVSPKMIEIFNGPAPISGMHYCGITPLLNAALDAALKPFVGQPDGAKHGLMLWMIRNAWGHWHDYAISAKDPYFSRVKASEVPPDVLHEMLFSYDECFFCGKMAERDDPYLPDFSWHKHCLLIAFARDAVLFGGQDAIKWGADVLNGYHFPIPLPPGMVQ